MRFSIRDLLWLTVVVAMGLGWWMSYRAVDAKRIAAVRQAHRFRLTLETAKTAETETHEIYSSEAGVDIVGYAFPFVDWSVLNVPLVEP